MILKRDQVADILADNLSELRFPLDEVPLLTEGEVVPIATSLYSEPRCWVRIRGWARDGDEMAVSFKRVKRPRAPRGRFMVRPREPHPADLASASGITYTDPDAVALVSEAVALCDEPEFVSDAISSRYGEVANGNGAHRGLHGLRHAAAVENLRDARHGLSVQHRLRDARGRAKHRHVNVSTDLHILGKALDKAARGRRLDPAAVLAEHLSPGDQRRLLALEARLDGVAEAAR